ncbi:hypothetical protein KYT87_09355 [Achromobacter sp. ES-001]|uniref:hypothetical protein n=1 Tax=Achromobacter sp. ES-001 TaxID=2860286 RepID=UPI001C641CEE|nr:hypothetical protein [Achromobacter sp. ES-001]QYJ23400.1 hypothetical protein KYT87_09355 [Achromobacter sp. ES-001]
MTTNHKPTLATCPVCGRAPDRFVVGQQRIDVIACPNGCKSHVFACVVHITSEQVKDYGWSDLSDVWNTIRLETGDDGLPRICFDRYPPGQEPIAPEGPYLPWSPAKSVEWKRHNAAITEARGSQ